MEVIVELNGVAQVIHDLMNILKNIKVDLILDNVFDKHLSKLEDLSMVQLKDECTSRNLYKTGRKVNDRNLWVSLLFFFSI